MNKYTIPIILIIIIVTFTAYVGFNDRRPASHAKSNIESVSGTVVDSSSGKALKGATVMIGSSTIRTDSNGKFTLDGVGQGDHAIWALNPGYENHISSISVRTGETLSLDILMNAVPKVIIR